MIGTNHLKSRYETLAREIETLKTKKIVYLERLNSRKINCELKKSKLDSMRNKIIRDQKECLDIQQKITLIRAKNNELEEKIQLLHDIKINLSEELDKFSPKTSLDKLIEGIF